MIVRPKSRHRSPFLAAVFATLGCSGDPEVTIDKSDIPESTGGNATGGNSGMSASGGMTATGTGGVAPSGGGGTGGALVGGTGGNDGSGGSDQGAPQPSVGCGLSAEQPRGEWVQQTPFQVNDADRDWWVWLPPSYDPSVAYPVVYTFHGCGGPDNILPMQEVAGNDAILVRGRGAATGNQEGCWTYAGDGPDVGFFDTSLDAVSNEFCIDTSRVFAVGYSSGGWLVNTLGCVRGDRLRAAGSVSGGVAINTENCVGEYARVMLHDLDDTTNRFQGPGNNGNVNELARLLDHNGCDAMLPPANEEPEPCARYQGCDDGYPVIECLTTGKGHDRQDNLALTAFWKLFSEL